jgi:hypothetical protein
MLAAKLLQILLLELLLHVICYLQLKICRDRVYKVITDLVISHKIDPKLTEKLCQTVARFKKNWGV